MKCYNNSKFFLECEQIQKIDSLFEKNNERITQK